MSEIRYLSGDGGENVIGDTGEYSPPATASSSENGGSALSEVN